MTLIFSLILITMAMQVAMTILTHVLPMIVYSKQRPQKAPLMLGATVMAVPAMVAAITPAPPLHAPAKIIKSVQL